MSVSLLRNKLALILTACVVLGLGLGLPAHASDGDGDGLEDGWEGAYFGNLGQNGADDPDGDGLTNANEQAAGTDPTRKDSDGDGLSDFAELFPAPGKPKTQPALADTDGDLLSDGDEELTWKTNPTLADTDGDTLPDNLEIQVTKTDPLKLDTDGGFSDDGTEVLVDHTNPLVPDDDLADSDGDTLTDWQELHTWKTDRFKTESDGDGLDDGEEVNTWKTNPAKADTDGDGLNDGEEVAATTEPLLPDTDGDGLQDGAEVHTWLTDPLLADTDWDALTDKDEIDTWKTNPLQADSDGGGVFDAVEVSDGTNPNSAADDAGEDPDGDGLSTLYEQTVAHTNPADADTDGDGAPDGQEVLPLFNHLVTLPLDADTDDDGLLDGAELGVWVTVGKAGPITVGGTNPTQFSSDDDDLGDGLESGLAEPQTSAKHPGATQVPPFVADVTPTSTTNPLVADTDGDGLLDSAEDKNGNGAWEPELGETDPGAFDTDGDGLDDGWEVQYADDPTSTEGKPLLPLDPSDGPGDNDGDGLSNLQEYQVTWPDKAGVAQRTPTNPRRKDTDKDGTSDKIEVLGNYQTATPTGSDPNTADTDGDGLADGVEDHNHNGLTDPGESNPRKADTDGDGLPDGVEDKNGNGVWDKLAGETGAAVADSDADGLNDGVEVNLFGTNPLSVDTDGDGLNDGLETGKKGDADPTTTTSAKVVDTDGDGLADGIEDGNHNGRVDTKETNPQKADTDGDGIADGVEAGKAGDADPATVTNPLAKDTDGDGLYDGMEDKNHNGKQDWDPVALTGETNAAKADSDNGGVPDGVEVLTDLTNPVDKSDDANGDSDGDGVKNKVELKLGLDPKNPDSDGDTISDGQESNGGQYVDSDGDGTPDAKDADSDGDGVPDATEAGDATWKTPAVDTDGDGVADFRDVDSDGDGLNDAVEPQYGTERLKTDTDGDGLADGAEVGLGLNPLDKDSDDDGLVDGDESTQDLDGDGLMGALDPDSDNDGLYDGTEAGLTLATITADTDLAKRAFVEDADPTTQTQPNKGDTDGDGQRDGAEDVNHNGRVDPGERDPLLLGDTSVLADTDGDGVPDLEEVVLATDPTDADSDDDGVPDGVEWNLACDTDLDGAPNAADADSDNDGLPDGLERGAGTAVAATNIFAFSWAPDVDPGTTTSPLLADSDGDGQRDGLEDTNGNGQVDADEGDPRNAQTQTVVQDDDGDGLSNAEEARVGSDPADPDTDEDGLLDGLEPNASMDYDHDGLPGVRDPDSDNDGLPDGLESGVAQAPAATDVGLTRFVADLDPTTRTLVLAPDSDGDGVRDGNEDPTLNGRVDADESDPRNPADAAHLPDADGDGLCDLLEATTDGKPNDADSDDDGVPDGRECNFSLDLDLDGRNALRDEDSDADGLGDGLEIGLTLATLPFPDATDLNTGVFLPDLDPTHTTWPANYDTDRGGLPDGVEDFSRDGRVDLGETDPLNPGDDGNVDGDIDGDGLDNKTELSLGTNPLKPDTDGDGLWDAVEVVDAIQPVDTDKDGKLDALDTDSDNDGVPDAFESGVTAADKGLKKPVDSDGDGTPDFRDLDSDEDGLGDGDEVLKYGTDPRLTDTDFGGLSDPIEVLVTLTNPLNPADDTEVIEPGARVRGTTPLSCQSTRTPQPGLALLVGLGALLVLWRRLRARTLGLVTLLLVVAGPALALTPIDVTGGRPNLDGAGIVNVDTALQLDLHSLSAGLQLQYAVKPLVIGTETRVLRSLVDQRIQADAVLAARVWDGLSLGVSVPVSLWQSGTLPSLYGPQSGPLDGGTAVGDITVAVKYVLWAERQGKLGLGAVVPVTIPVGDPALYMGRPGPTVTPTAILSTALGPWRVAGNVGVRAQQTQTLFNVSDGPVVRVAVAASLNASVAQDSWLGSWVPDGWWLDATLVHESPIHAPWTNSTNERLEATLAVGWPLGDDLFGGLGTGFGLWPGNGVPAFRPFFSIRYAPQDKSDPPPPHIIDLPDGTTREVAPTPKTEPQLEDLLGPLPPSKPQTPPPTLPKTPPKD